MPSRIIYLETKAGTQTTGANPRTTYINNNEELAPNFGERRYNGELMSTAFVVSKVNQVIGKRMVKKQQMRWAPKGSHLLLRIPTICLLLRIVVVGILCVKTRCTSVASRQGCFIVAQQFIAGSAQEKDFQSRQGLFKVSPPGS